MVRAFEASQAMSGAGRNTCRGEIPVELNQQPSDFLNSQFIYVYAVYKIPLYPNVKKERWNAMIDTSFVKIQIDDDALGQQILKQVDEKMEEIGTDKLFYSLDDLMQITSFSKGHIMNTFFNDPRFKRIRRKVGRKWIFPVMETNEFLKEWASEQPHE